MNSYSDRYSSRVDYSYLESPRFLGETAVSGVDSLSLQSSHRAPAAARRSAAQLELLSEHLSERDQQLLKALQHYRLMTTDQLQRQIMAGHTSTDSARRIARRCLKRLTNHGLIRPLGRRIGGIRSGSSGMVWTLTAQGYRLLGETKRKRSSEPALTHVRHVLAIAELATALIETARRYSYELHIETEPACWRIVTGDQATLKPDLFIRIANADTELSWFVEVDRSTESGPVIAKKLKRYDSYWRTGTEQADHRVFPKVAWIAPDAHRAAFIDRHTHHQQLNPALFSTAPAEDAIDLLTGFVEPGQDQP